MSKKSVLILITVLLAFSFTGCKAKEEEASDKPLNQELVSIMPTEGFIWAYQGPEEYYHEMKLDTITTDANKATYNVAGEVKDVSTGELNTDYSIKITYIINHDSIVQIKEEDAMLDSTYDRLTILKTPLVVGNKWEEDVIDENGVKGLIKAEITEVTETDRGTKYKVIYRNEKENYSEIRKFNEGYGLISFTQIVSIDNDDYHSGYVLYGKNSGYKTVQEVAGNETTSTEEANTETTEETSGETTEDANSDTVDDEDVTDNETSTTEETSTSDDTTNEDETSTEADSSEEDDLEREKQKVRTAIHDFNAAWIEYVNNNNNDFFNHVTTNGKANKNARNFNKEGLTEAFLKIDISSVKIDGNTATAKVYEEIEKIKDGETTIAKYNWLYDFVKKDGTWLINGYTK